MCPQNTGAATNSSPQPVPYPPFQPHINNPPPPLQPQHHQQPPVIIVNPPTSLTPAVWTSGLLECFNDPSSCLLTLCCPCVAVGQIAEIVSRGRTGCLCAGTIFLLTNSVGLFGFYTCNNRMKLRAHFSLPGHQCGDFCTHCWCP
ncbi:hypothetical protein SAY87_023542 [Trapa incisa]|uniref:Uncharacterized protein n=1 Tax=Trapa incisa TaxID=236973 RepID=A0AAN7L6H5_9MYRT|nr:hypothetical protein SAY87_023542 [Trapa incisa]